MEREFTLSEIDATAEWLWQQVKTYKVIAFYGEMGAGKTTFVHALCHYLRVKDRVSSPTFSLINEYHFINDGKDEIIYHMDLYRLQDENEAIRAGVEDCLYSRHYCFVEWPEKAPDIFPQETLHVSISLINESTRRIELA